MQIKIAPSILSADFSVMGETIKKLEACGADLIHCDVMDGSFVEPITFGGQMIKNIRPLTKIAARRAPYDRTPQDAGKVFCGSRCGYNYRALRRVREDFSDIFKGNA